MNNTVLLFVTNVRHYHDRSMVAGVLDQLVGEDCWYIDLTDVDKVLRVEACIDKEPAILAALGQLGFTCTKLTDEY